jgi:hypothetical protein
MVMLVHQVKQEVQVLLVMLVVLEILELMVITQEFLVVLLQELVARVWLDNQVT